MEVPLFLVLQKETRVLTVEFALVSRLLGATLEPVTRAGHHQPLDLWESYQGWNEILQTMGQCDEFDGTRRHG
jgi:hypothetical protein